ALVAPVVRRRGAGDRRDDRRVAGGSTMGSGGTAALNEHQDAGQRYVQRENHAEDLHEFHSRQNPAAAGWVEDGWCKEEVFSEVPRGAAPEESSVTIASN